MNYTSLFLFFFGAIGVFNSFLISVNFLFFKNLKKLSNTLFGLFLLFLSERALRSLIYFFSDITPNSYSKFGPITFLFIGPFLLLYIVSVVRPESKIVKFWKHHILLWIIIAIILHVVFPFRNDPVFYKKYILKGINLQWLSYIIISGFLVYRYLRTNPEKTKEDKIKRAWLVLLLVLVLWLIYFFVSFNYFVIGSIVFSVIFYSFFIYFFFKKKERFRVFGMEKKYINKTIDKSKATYLIQRLHQIMQTQKPYKNPKLKLTDLAGELGISSHQFSQLLNENLGKSFATFVSEYRIQEAKQLIQAHTKYTLDAIGYESGFNSKSSFYNSFKRIEGITPSKYRANYLV